MKTKIALIATLLALAGLTFYNTTTALAQQTPETGQSEGHPFIKQALHDLEQAKKELQQASHDFGGHRVAALKACDQAIAECKLALDYDKK